MAHLPSEIHSSAHQVRHDNSLLGEYEIRIYRGVEGPVVVLEAISTSPLPLEYLSERAVLRFLEVLPVAGARFFEHHTRANAEIWVEVGFVVEGFRRAVCSISDVLAAVSRIDASDPASAAIGTIAGAYSVR